MAPTTPSDTSASQSSSQQSLSTLQPPRPLAREGAVILPSRAEQALEEAMFRSSPPPEPLLGKRAHEEDTEEEGGGDEPDEESRAATETQFLDPSPANVTAATLRYATHKKLRTEQRNELETFLQVRLR